MMSPLMEERITHALARLATLSKTAELHAKKEGDLETMDRTIDACRADKDAAEIQNVGLCYGAWLGEKLRCDFGASWLGVLEPSAPRLAVAERVISPIDAVLRRLTSESAPSLRQILDTISAWKTSTKSREEILEINRKVWDGLAGSPRFAGLPPKLMESKAALDAVDPWIAIEGLARKRGHRA